MKGFEIKYNTPLHRVICDAVNERARMSRRRFESARHARWKQAEETFLAYIPEKDADAKRRGAKERGIPQFVTLEIPYSYALLLSAHTYWSAVFLGRNPIFQYAGRHGEPEMRVQALEALIEYQVSVGRLLPALYVWLLDVGKYGLGVVGTYWDEEIITTARFEERQEMWMGLLPVPGKTKRVKVTKRDRGYVGNRLFNVRPFDFLPDPRVAVMNFQQGEFCGRRLELGWNDIQRRKAEGTYFNIDVLEKMRSAHGGKRWGEDGAQGIELPGSEVTDTGTKILPFFPGVEMTIELIPSEWGLGGSNIPEKWVFTVADEQVVIGAQPQGLLHNKFPFSVLEYEIDGYSLNSRGMLEIAKPLNDTLTWLFNSHFYNVRKVLNDMLIYDPTRIRSEDIEDPGPGKRIRLRPAAYGTDVRAAIHQLQVVDVTQTHMQDAGQVIDLLQRLLGINDNIMGQVNPGGRKTATEVRTSSSFSVNRMKTSAEYFSATGFTDLSTMLVQNTQQLYDLDREFKIAGDLVTSGGSNIRVDPESIQGFFDFTQVDGTMPIDRFALANLWKEVLAGAGQMPFVAEQYDLGRIFAHMARLGGLKNIEQFKIKVRPDMEIQNDASRGNLVPMGGIDGQAAGTGAGQPANPEGIASASGVGRLT